MYPLGPTVAGIKEPGGAFCGFLGDALDGLWDVIAFQSAVGLLALFLVYSLFYWALLYGKSAYFIEISPFRIWRDSVPNYLSDGLASRLVGELLCLQSDVREHGFSPDAGRSGVQFHKASWQTPMARQVTLEYKGVSPEAVHEFLRRLLRRHVLITTEAIPVADGLRLIGRSTTAGPWEVKAPGDPGSDAFGKALREFAVRAIVEVQPKTRAALANALAYRQSEAYGNEDHDEALLLAQLGLVAMPDHAVQFFNLGHAYQSLDDQSHAIDAHDRAIERFNVDIRQASRGWRRLFWTRRRRQYRKHLSLAHGDRGFAHARRAALSTTHEDQVENLEEAVRSLDQALELDPGNSNHCRGREEIRRRLAELKFRGTIPSDHPNSARSRLDEPRNRAAR